MPELPDAALALFAKAPRAGGVKTRLAGLLGEDGAAQFHRLCVIEAWSRLATLPRTAPYLYCDSHCLEFEALAGPGRFRLQRGSDLGERMRHCLGELLGSSGSRALIMGSDAPTLPSAQIEEALVALAQTDVVLGPSEDGGFTLIGARRVAEEMFHGVRWSSADTRATTLQAVRRAGLVAVETTTRAYDVDTPSDLAKLRHDPELPQRLREWIDRSDGAPS